jgi:Cu+-exporting ATPase
MAQTQKTGGGGERVLVLDLVCGMTIDRAAAVATSDYRGQTYYFCSAACKAKFDKEPSLYAYSGGPNG